MLTKYIQDVPAIQQYLVSASGQMSMPAAVRHRWHLDNGGPVDVIDLGFGVLTVPAGSAQRLLGDVLSREDHAAYVASLATRISPPREPRGGRRPPPPGCPRR